MDVYCIQIPVVDDYVVVTQDTDRPLELCIWYAHSYVGNCAQWRRHLPTFVFSSALHIIICAEPCNYLLHYFFCCNTSSIINLIELPIYTAQVNQINKSSKSTKTPSTSNGVRRQQIKRNSDVEKLIFLLKNCCSSKMVARW